jgi:recombinational DNA repair protein (RecF pathway)
MTTYKDDPRRITAKFKSHCSGCGEPVNKGETLYYWPRTKNALCEKCGEPEYASFKESAMDEDFYSGRSR